ncbi:MAG: hypothetical protein D6775_01110 [Caldilineae bacterium]|nr:MAG: hypothetical protein D6775_01110 [Caldilineae bacterium]
MENSEDIQFKLTDELWEDMAALEGVPIASLVIWDSSLVDDNLDQPVTDEERVYVDFELYLSNQTLLELYGAAVLPDEDSDAMVGLDNIGESLSRLAREGAVIKEIACDQHDRLVLVLAGPSGQTLLVPVTAWLESTWDTLPEEAL